MGRGRRLQLNGSAACLTSLKQVSPASGKAQTKRL